MPRGTAAAVSLGWLRSEVAAPAPIVLSSAAVEDGGQALADGGQRRRMEAGLIWASMGLDGPHPDLPPCHLPGSNNVPKYSEALHATRGHLGHLSRTWWWWPSPPSEVVDQLCVARLLDLAIWYLVPAGEVVADENHARLLSWWMMMALACCYLAEGTIITAFSLPGLLRGKP
jgi:hypothetical protein